MHQKRVYLYYTYMFYMRIYIYYIFNVCIYQTLKPPDINRDGRLPEYPILFQQTLLHKCENRYKRICGVCMMVIEISEANETLRITLDLRRCLHLWTWKQIKFRFPAVNIGMKRGSAWWHLLKNVAGNFQLQILNTQGPVIGRYTVWYATFGTHSLGLIRWIH